METNNKLREAVTKILNLTNSLDENCAVDPVEIRDIARTALAAPPRNCDVGTAEEQEKRFHDFCRARHLPRMEESRYCAYKCPLEGDTCCELQWAQMPYESEATDGE